MQKKAPDSKISALLVQIHLTMQIEIDRAAAFLMPLTLRARVRHLALITHAVPAERVRRHLPPQFELETFSMNGGGQKALVSVACFLNQGLHWSMLPWPRLTFEQVNYQTYVRYKGRVGVYFFATYLATPLSFLLERAVARNAYYGTFQVHRIQSREHGYGLYRYHVWSNHGETEIELTADRNSRSVSALKPYDPFVSGNELVQHLSYRLHGFLKSSIGIYVDQMVLHPRMNPWFGELVSGRFELWERLGILKAKEVLPAFSVIVQPEIGFTMFPPFPIVKARRTRVYQLETGVWSASGPVHSSK